MRARNCAGRPHVGTTEGRFRVFGGTSLRWGGQVLSMAEDGVAAWPVGAEELRPFVVEAERLLGVGTLPFEAAGFFEAIRAPVPAMLEELRGVDARVSKWMAFPRRNLAPSWGRICWNARGCICMRRLLNCCWRRMGGRIEAVMVRMPAGAIVRFEADEVVVAAGTVETSRLMLASRSVAAEGVGECE